MVFSCVQSVKVRRDCSFLAHLAKGNVSFCHHLVSVTKFQFSWPSGFREKDFLEIDQSETRIACGGHV
jgi:hypothetical protein